MLAIIDGDVVCHVACKSRWESKARIEIDEHGKRVSFVRLDEDGKRKELEFTNDEDTKYLTECWEHLQKHIKGIMDQTFATQMKMAIKGENNFRHEIYPEYKLKRKHDPSKQNIFIPLLRQLMVAEDMAVKADGCEADDLIRQWAEEARTAGEPFIICSNDKDLKCIHGRHFNIKKNEFFQVTQEESLKFFYEQLLMGDPVDNIKGVLGVGPVGAKKMLALVDTEEEYQRVVVREYRFIYKKDWYKELVLNGKLLHIRRHPEDNFDPSEWSAVKQMLEENNNEGQT